jgi:hypothetical protein
MVCVEGACLDCESLRYGLRLLKLVDKPLRAQPKENCSAVCVYLMCRRGWKGEH